MAIFQSKNDFFGLRQAVEDCPRILMVLDTKKQIVGTHRSSKHNLQHPYAPKFAVFHEEKATNGPFLVTYWFFLASYKQLKDPPPPILRVLDAKSKLYAHTDYKSTIYSICMHQNLLFFMEKLPKMAVSWSKIEYFGLRQAVTDPPLPF